MCRGECIASLFETKEAMSLTRIDGRGSAVLGAVARLSEVALAVALVLVATFATAAGSAGAATTDASRYHASPAPTRHPVVDVSVAPRAHGQPGTRCVATPNGGYDDSINLSPTIARQKAAISAPNTTGDDDCDGLPVFMPGEDTPETTSHISRAITAGQPSRLTYGGPGSGPGRGYIRDDPRCAGRSAAQWCDEYPFQSTLQAGRGASLQLVPASEQWTEAGKLSRFYSLCGLSAGDDFLVAELRSASDLVDVLTT